MISATWCKYLLSLQEGEGSLDLQLELVFVLVIAYFVSFLKGTCAINGCGLPLEVTSYHWNLKKIAQHVFLGRIKLFAFVCIHQCEESPLHANFILGLLVKSAVTTAIPCYQEGLSVHYTASTPNPLYIPKAVYSCPSGKKHKWVVLEELWPHEMQSESRGEQFLSCQNISIARAPYMMSCHISCSTSEVLSEMCQTTSAQVGLYISGNFISL